MYNYIVWKKKTVAQANFFGEKEQNSGCIVDENADKCLGMNEAGCGKEFCGNGACSMPK